MKRILLTSVLLTTGMLVMAAMVTAGVPSLINYQGRLTNSSGNPLDTTVSITFSIYSDSVGGVAIWSETYPAVNVVKGLFTVKLGSLSPGNWDEDLFIHSYPPGRFLGIKVGGNAEMAARSMFTTTPFAVQASCVDGFTPGSQNIDSGSFTVVAGDSNTVRGDYSSITGGYGNEAIGDYSVISGGMHNIAGSDLVAADTCGGELGGLPGEMPSGNSEYEHHTGETVGGGINNQALANYTTVSGGLDNTAGCISGSLKYGERSTVGGGWYNRAPGYAATIAGGGYNTAGYCST